MLISDNKQIGAMDKSEDRCLIGTAVSILGLIHGSSLIHIIHGHRN